MIEWDCKHGRTDDAMTPCLLCEEGRRMEEVGLLPNGSTLFRRKNEVGGYIYYSDEIGGGVGVWDTALVDESTLLAAIVAEHRRRREEK